MVFTRCASSELQLGALREVLCCIVLYCIVISEHGLSSSYEGQQGAANGQDSWGVFQGCIGLWTAGWWFARRLHQLKASIVMDLGITIFLIFAILTRGLEIFWAC